MSGVTIHSFSGLQYVPSLGWSREALQAGAAQLGNFFGDHRFCYDPITGLVRYSNKWGSE